MDSLSSRANPPKKNLTFPQKLTKTHLWSAVALCSLALLLVPSIKLLFAQHQESSPYYLENTSYTDDTDPYGYLPLLSATFLRKEPSQIFQTPAPLEQRGNIPQQATPENLETFAAHYNLQGKWLDRTDIELSLKRDSSLKGCQMFQFYSSSFILAVNEPNYHFIGLLEAGSGYVYAFDPFVGRVIYTCDKLLEVWEGKAFTAY